MDQVDRLEHWVRELLTYVHLPAGEQKPVDLRIAARDCLDRFAVEMRRRGVVGTSALAEDLPPVRGDPTLLGQVFGSLVANAVEAMPHGGRLEIRGVRRDEYFVKVEIRDTGAGMSTEQLSRALKPFHTTKAQGLGVGLPLARRIVERMGGRIRLSSRLGEGTTVELDLPAAGR
jgi:signal transduction histidine kinase